METALATETLAFLQCGSEIAGVCPHSLRETAPAAFLIKHTTAQLRLFSGLRLDCGQGSWFLIRSHDRSLPLSNRSNSRGRLYIALREILPTTRRYDAAVFADLDPEPHRLPFGTSASIVWVPRRVFQCLLAERATPERCIEAYYRERTRLKSGGRNAMDGWRIHRRNADLPPPPAACFSLDLCNSFLYLAIMTEE
jgi:hypothetical protein